MFEAVSSECGSVMTTNSPVRAFDPDELRALFSIYDECLQELLTWYSMSEPRELNGMELTLAKRIMAASQSGIHNREDIRKTALRGLLPESILKDRIGAAK
jgi:hypothetical protein